MKKLSIVFVIMALCTVSFGEIFAQESESVSSVNTYSASSDPLFLLFSGGVNDNGKAFFEALQIK